MSDPTPVLPTETSELPASRDVRITEGTFLERKRLRQTTALIGGAGALGNEIAKNLAMLGLGRIMVVDFDHVEDHNATRSVLLSMDDMEEAARRQEPKARVVARSIRRIRGDVRAVPFVGDIAEIGPGILARTDLVFSAFDNLAARVLLNRTCSVVRKAMIDGGLGNRAEEIGSGEVTIYDAAEGACFACGMGSRARRALLKSTLGGQPEGCTRRASRILQDGGVPTTPMMASIIGGLQVMQGLELLMEHPDFPAPIGTTHLLSTAGRGDLEVFAPFRDPSCPFHEAAQNADVVLPFRSDESTLDDLGRCAQQYFGRRVIIEIPEPVCTGTRCEKCGRADHGWRAFRKIRSSNCPSCNGSVRPEGRLPAVFVPGRGDRCAQTLRDIGFAWGERFIVRCRGDVQFSPSSVEIGGDFDHLMSAT